LCCFIFSFFSSYIFVPHYLLNVPPKLRFEITRFLLLFIWSLTRTTPLVSGQTQRMEMIRARS
jgi:hypothetical protein